LDEIPRHQRNEGEGNKTAAREYNEAQRRFAESGKVEEKAREAERATSGPERVELERAEAIRKRGSASTPERLSRRAREQTARAGDYLARNAHEYPFEALLIAGLIGYGLGFLIHRSWSNELWVKGHSGEPNSAPVSHSGDILRPLE